MMKQIWSKNIIQPQNISELNASFGIGGNNNNKNNKYSDSKRKTGKSGKSGSGTSYTLLSQSDLNNRSKDSSTEDEDFSYDSESSEEDIIDVAGVRSKFGNDMAQYGSYFTEVRLYFILCFIN